MSPAILALVLLAGPPTPDELEALLRGRRDSPPSVASAPVSTNATFPAPLLDRFESAGGTRPATSPAEAVRSLRIDTFSGWDFGRRQFYGGAGVVLAHRGPWRAHVHGGWERLGAGVVRRVPFWRRAPSVGVDVGGAVFRDFDRSRWSGSVFVNLWRW